MASRILQEKAKVELQSIIEQIELNNEALAVSREEGDLRENAAYQIAIENVAPLAKRKQELEEILLEPVVMQQGNLITYGRLVEVRLLGTCDAVGENVRPSDDLEPQLLLYDISGDTVLSGVLSGESPLGRLIHNALPGDFVVQCADSFRKYRVTICDDRVQEYLVIFPANKSERIAMLMEEGV